MKIDGPAIQMVERLPEMKIDNNRDKGAGFGQMLNDAVNKVDQAQKTANDAINDLAVGRSNRIHETMMRAEEAGISLRMLLQVRNKALDAYNEIMRMHV